MREIRRYREREREKGGERCNTKTFPHDGSDYGPSNIRHQSGLTRHFRLFEKRPPVEGYREVSISLFLKLVDTCRFGVVVRHNKRE